MASRVTHRSAGSPSFSVASIRFSSMKPCRVSWFFLISKFSARPTKQMDHFTTHSFSHQCNSGHPVRQCHKENDDLCRQPRHPCHISLHWSSAQRNCTPPDWADRFHLCLSPQRCQTAPPCGTTGATQRNVSTGQYKYAHICQYFHSCIHSFIHSFNCCGDNRASKPAQSFFLQAWIHRGASNHTTKPWRH